MYKTFLYSVGRSLQLTVFATLSKSLEPVVTERGGRGRNSGMRLRPSSAGSSVAPGTHGKTLTGSSTIPNTPPYLSCKLQFCLFITRCSRWPVTTATHSVAVPVANAVSCRWKQAHKWARWSLLHGGLRCVSSELSENLSLIAALNSLTRHYYYTLILSSWTLFPPPQNSKTRHGTLIKTRLSLAAAQSLFHLVDNVILHRQ